AIVSASDTFFIASAIMAGPAPAMLAMTIDSTALAWRRSAGMGTRRLLFNATAPSLSLWIASHLFQFLVGNASALAQSTQITGMLLPLAAMTAVYFGLNSGFTARAIALESGAPFLAVWKRLWPLAVNYI